MIEESLKSFVVKRKYECRSTEFAERVLTYSVV